MQAQPIIQLDENIAGPTMLSLVASDNCSHEGTHSPVSTLSVSLEQQETDESMPDSTSHRGSQSIPPSLLAVFDPNDATPIFIHREDNPDEGYGNSINSTSNSLTPSVNDYPIENGRRYHRYKEGAYHLPNDQKEQEMEDLRHHIVVEILYEGSLHLAPIGNKPQEILDIGTGTGLWAIESESWQLV